MLEFNDIQTRSIPSNPILSATFELAGRLASGHAGKKTNNSKGWDENPFGEPLGEQAIPPASGRQGLGAGSRSISA